MDEYFFEKQYLKIDLSQAIIVVSGSIVGGMKHQVKKPIQISRMIVAHKRPQSKICVLAM